MLINRAKSIIPHHRKLAEKMHRKDALYVQPMIRYCSQNHYSELCQLHTFDSGTEWKRALIFSLGGRK